MASLPSQPSEQQAYESSENPVSKKPSEYAASASGIPQRQAVETRDANDVPGQDATSTPLAQGISGGGSGENIETSADQNPEDQKLAPPSEGRVEEVVTRDAKPGAAGQERSFTANLDAYVSAPISSPCYLPISHSSERLED
jgi:hypothetical protein